MVPASDNSIPPWDNCTEFDALAPGKPPRRSVRFVVGHIWRYIYDEFGWTSRPSQMYERDILRWANPMFHFGVLAVFLGHVMGLAVPQGYDGRGRDFGGEAPLHGHLHRSDRDIFTIVGLIGLVYRRHRRD